MRVVRARAVDDLACVSLGERRRREADVEWAGMELKGKTGPELTSGAVMGVGENRRALLTGAIIASASEKGPMPTFGSG